MATEVARKRLFGERAVELGFLAAEDVLEALRAQQEARIVFGKHLFLGEILLLQRKLSARQIADILRQSAEPPEEAEDVHGRRFFGDVAIDMGFCTAHQVFDALNVQRGEDVAGGKHRLVGEILFERGYLTKVQVEQVVHRMVRTVGAGAG
jgi:hypothetical protein